MFHKESRREFLKKMIIAGGVLALGPKALADTPMHKITKDTFCTLYRSVNGTPENNTIKVIEMMGGIDKIIGSEDIVVIKPNVQWWNQGAPNLSTLKTFVDLIMERPGGFHGEVIVAENCHRGNTPWSSLSSGWAQTFTRNSDIPDIHNLNDLSGLLKKQYGTRFSTVHWIDITYGNKRVYGPEDGEGYIYCDGTGGVPLIKCENGGNGENHRTTVMTYPIFSSDKGTVIDFKNGIWDKNKYTGQSLRFVNFSALNHHSTYCGATSAVKNYMGITDLSGGPDPSDGGILTGNHHNFHSFPFNKWAPGPDPGMLGKAIGTFMKTVRKADMNITSAEWVGLSSRINLPVARTRAVLACTDPVAIDYHAAKYILYSNSKIPIHNPDNKIGPLHQYLYNCAVSGSFVFDEEKVKVASYDFKTGAFQNDDELIIHGDKRWGSNMKHLIKYFVLRYVS
jgi:hypothetical protein